VTQPENVDPDKLEKAALVVDQQHAAMPDAILTDRRSAPLIVDGSGMRTLGSVKLSGCGPAASSPPQPNMPPSVVYIMTLLHSTAWRAEWTDRLPRAPSFRYMTVPATVL